MTTLRHIVDSLPKSKNTYDLYGNPVAYFLARPLSYPLTWLLILLGASANMTSVMSLLFAVCACIVAAIGGSPALLLLLVVVWLTFDCADGNIARVTKTGSKAGEFMDAMSGYLLSAGLFPALAWGYDRTPESLLWAGIASTTSLWARLLLNKANVLLGQGRDPAGDVGAGRWGALVLSIYNFSGFGFLILAAALFMGEVQIYLLVQSVLGACMVAGAFFKSWGSLVAAQNQKRTQ